jgi:hypothetical protein
MTGAELEIAATEATADLASRSLAHRGDRVETCANCAAPLAGPFCHDCGQSADLRKRSILHLAWEAIEGMFHFDGRLARTLPLLFLRPGILARDLIEGRVARHTPPFRTFLVALLLYILAAETAIHRQQQAGERPQVKASSSVAPATAPKVAAQKSLAELLESDDPDIRLDGPGLNPAWAETLKQGLKTAVANPAYFLTVLFGWAHRLAFLMLPITTILLSVLYACTRRIYVHDHVMVASNLLSFSLLTNGFGLILPGGLGPVWFTFLAFWTPVNMFQTLRGAYGSSRVGALLKTSILWPGSILTFGVLALALLALTLTQL